MLRSVTGVMPRAAMSMLVVSAASSSFTFVCLVDDENDEVMSGGDVVVEVAVLTADFNTFSFDGAIVVADVAKIGNC